MSAKAWSDKVATLAVDALLDAKIVKQEDFDRAVAVVSEEIYARLVIQDFPSLTDSDPDV